MPVKSKGKRIMNLMNDSAFILLLLVLLAASVIVMVYISHKRGFEVGHLAGRKEVGAERRQFMIFWEEQFEKHLASNRRIITVDENVVYNKKSGTNFAVLTRKLMQNDWKPDPEMAHIVADKMERMRLLDQQHAR